MNAASSDNPSAPGWVAIGPKKRAIRRSSAEISSDAAIVSSGSAAELGRAQTPCELIENGVDHPSLVTFDKSGGDVRIFGNHDTRRHVASMRQFVGARPQRRTQNRIDALERPTLRQSIIDQRIELALLAHDAGHHVAEESSFGRQVLCTLYFTPDPMTFELGQNLIQAASCKIHLIESLHRGKTRSTAFVCFARIVVSCSSGGHHRQTNVCLRATIVSAARAAAPPLSPSSTWARAFACASLSTVRIPFPRASRSLTARSMSARADSFATMSKWWVSPRITHPSATTPS